MFYKTKEDFKKYINNYIINCCYPEDVQPLQDKLFSVGIFWNGYTSEHYESFDYILISDNTIYPMTSEEFAKSPYPVINSSIVLNIVIVPIFQIGDYVKFFINDVEYGTGYIASERSSEGSYAITKDNGVKVIYPESKIERMCNSINDNTLTIPIPYGKEIDTEKTVILRDSVEIKFKDKVFTDWNDIKNTIVWTDSIKLPVYATEWQEYWNAYTKFLTIAKYLNGDWNAKNETIIFFIKPDENGYLVENDTKWHPQVVYFKTKELAERAIEIMGDELKNLFII